MKIEAQDFLRRTAMALMAVVITAATFGAINAAVVLPSSGTVVVSATPAVCLHGHGRSCPSKAVA